MSGPRIGELFAGYGGLGLGVRAVLGGEVVWFSEFDEAPSKILAHHWPDIPNYGDIRQIDWSTVPPVDILTGGFPCQDVSLAGARAGIREGTRSGLWSEFARAIEQLRPGMVVIENVRGLLSATAGGPMEPDPWGLGDGATRPVVNALGAVLGDLASLGYDTRRVGLRAADAGAPHGRYRVFIVAYPAGQRWGEGWAESAGRERGSADLFRGASAADSEHVIGYGARRAWHGWPEPADSPAADAGRERLGEHSGEPPAEEARSAGGDVVDGDGGLRPDQDWGPYRPAVERWERVTGQLAPPPTKGDGKNGGHRLSALFVEWMMGLPAGHVTAPEIGLTRNAQLKALGNGVVPQQAALALRTLLEAPA